MSTHVFMSSSSAKLSRRVIKVKPLSKIAADDILFIIITFQREREKKKALACISTVRLTDDSREMSILIFPENKNKSKDRLQ